MNAASFSASFVLVAAVVEARTEVDEGDVDDDGDDEVDEVDEDDEGDEDDALSRFSNTH
jgi:hypothetical protein